MTQNPDARPATPSSLAGLRAGAAVGGYRLLRRLGAGGMGVVWEVADAEGNHVAMKILHPQIAADPMARRRLDREANVLARVKDSRVARILDIETGDGADGSGGTFAITELIDGPTRQHEVDHEGAYDLTTDARDLADLAHGLVDSLTSVHAAGVIHRDLKPSNVMLGAQGPVLIDFGIAQVADDVRLTQTGQVTGTPGFIPPEMLDGGEPTADVDWYACAGVLLFTVTGLAPFGSGAWQVVFRRVYGGTPELGTLEQESPALARAFTAALAPEAKDRLGPDGLLEVLDEIAEGGTGEEAVDRLLGPEEDEPGSEESERNTNTFAGYGTAPGYGVAPGYDPTQGSPQDAYGATSASPAAYGSPVSAASGAEGGYGYSAPSASSAASVQPPPAIPPRSWYQNGSPMPAGMAQSAQSMQYGTGSPAPVTPSGAYPRPAPSGQVPMFPYSGYHPTASPSAYPRPVAGPAPAAMPATGAMAGPMATGARPAQVRRFTAPTRTADLPDWAQEPQRRPRVMLALWFAMSALGIMRPGWMAILAAVLAVIAGTVGRAQDARRWNRLQRGSASPSDTSRMWVATPWYLLRSLLSTGFAFILGLMVAALTLWISNVTGIMEDSPSSLGSVPLLTRFILFFLLEVAFYLLVLWLVPWGAATRRGGAHIINMLTHSDHSRRRITTILLAIGVIALLLNFAGLAPVPSTAPFGD